MLKSLILIIIIALVIISYHLLTSNKKKLKKFRNEWETGTFFGLSEGIETVSSYWSNKKANTTNYYGIDQLTWDDLAMKEVFEKLNYTQTTIGSEYLFNKLRDINPAFENAQQEEELYTLLMHNKELREEVLLVLSDLGKRNYSNSSAAFYALTEKKINHAYVYILLGCLPIASVMLMFASLSYGIISLVLSFLLNMFIYYKNKRAIENDLFAATYIASIVNTGKRLANVKRPEFASYANGFKRNVKPIKKVSFFGNLVLSKSGGEFDVLIDYFRILFMLDFIAYNTIMRTIAKNKAEYRNMWEQIGELDAAIAVAFHRKSLDTYCTPYFIQHEGLSFTNMAHPLVSQPVTNTSMLNKSTLITGSNASGKSTYIKAIAINSILAQTINTVLAETWSMKRSYIVTSMAIQDNVLQGDSYFIAEIKSLKRIIKLSEEGKPCISFVDEILKGTNTIERIAASAAMMEWFSSNSGINIIASHDIELTEIAKDAYDNFHFRESIENDEVLFDYIIHSGPSKTRNAIKLLEIVDYPVEVIEKANRLADHFTENREWPEIQKEHESLTI